MTAVPPDERISAYLDGALTAPEHYEVQQQLINSPEWRAELDLVSWARVAVRSMPAHVAPAGFFESLLRDGLPEPATPEPATPEPVTAAPAAPGPAPTSPTPSGDEATGTVMPLRRSVGVHRVVRWAAAASAAAAIVVVALLMPARGSVDPSVPRLADSHAVRSSVSDDPVMQLATLRAFAPFGR
jgi:anti-sigma factor RsiW